MEVCLGKGPGIGAPCDQQGKVRGSSKEDWGAADHSWACQHPEKRARDSPGLELPHPHLEQVQGPRRHPGCRGTAQSTRATPTTCLAQLHLQRGWGRVFFLLPVMEIKNSCCHCPARWENPEQPPRTLKDSRVLDTEGSSPVFVIFMNIE